MVPLDAESKVVWKKEKMEGSAKADEETLPRDVAKRILERGAELSPTQISK